MFKEKALVLYKQSPALIKELNSEKIHITLQKGEKKVRPKDLLLLHPGPLNSLAELKELEADPAEAWELFQGETPEASDLAELIYGEFTPSAAWSLFMLLNRTAWFRGTYDAIEVTTPEEREQRESSAQKKEEAKLRLEAFKERLKTGSMGEEDQEYMDELYQQALNQAKRSVILKELKKEQTPENAHRQLLKWKKVDKRWNPHPLRYTLALENPELELVEFPTEERLDLTHQTSYAIDDEGSKDPDDAIAFDGQYFWVHIADAAAMVPPGSAVDLEAQERGGNLYLPEKTVTMLPAKATEQLALGLQPERSPAFSFRFQMNDQGEILEGEHFLSWIKVERLSYADCDKRMDQSPFKEMEALMLNFQARRMDQGAASINMPEVKIRVKENGPVEITPLPRLRSRDMVAEAMMLTGSWVASFCSNQGISIPYASQPSPEQEAPEGDDMASQFARRKTMQRSRISFSPGRHSGLGLDLYTRATSPLRRYSDLLVMQQLRRKLLGQELLSEEEVMKAGAQYETQASLLAAAERRSNTHWKLVYLEEQKDWKAEAILVDILEGNRGHFLIPSIAMETRLPLKEQKKLNSKAILGLRSVDHAENQASFKLIKWL